MTPPDGMTPPEDGDVPSGAMPGGRGVRGTVESVDGSTITLTTEDDETVTVTTSDDTEVSVTVELELSDLAEGDTVSVQGETGDDGSVAASVIRRGDLDSMPGGFAGPGGGMPPGAGGTDDGTDGGTDGSDPSGGATTTTEA